MQSKQLIQQLKQAANPEKASGLARYFKTGLGEYGEGDIFFGITMPELRRIAKQFYGLPLSESAQLLRSKVHEQRAIALLILVYQFEHTDKAQKQEIYSFYLANTRWINNWDLVDGSAAQIIGAYSREYGSTILTKLARSHNLWERRIAIIATFDFINTGDPAPTFTIAEILLQDSQDLIQKATGWMLREVGKRIDQNILESWLQEDNRYKLMPRTMLRYAIERFEPALRQQYLCGSV